MADQFADDFNGYGTNTALMLNGLYASNGGSLIADPDPLATGYVYQSNNGTSLRRALSSPQTVVGQAFRVWFPNLPGGSGTPCLAAMGPDDSDFNDSVSLRVTSTGVINVYDTANDSPLGNLLGTSSVPVITANAWQHVEWKLTANASAGTLEVRVNGVAVIGPLTGIDTRITSINQVFVSDRDRLGTGGVNAVDVNFKDYYVWDGSGGINDDFAGSVTVFGRTTTSDVSFNWVPSTGSTGFNLLANSPPNDSVDYISADDTPPAASLFGLTALPADVTAIRTMITQVRARKIDGGTGTLQTGLKSSSSTSLGSDRPITTAFTYYEDAFPLDPHTSAAWTPVSATAAEIQVNRTS